MLFRLKRVLNHVSHQNLPLLRQCKLSQYSKVSPLPNNVHLGNENKLLESFVRIQRNLEQPYKVDGEDILNDLVYLSNHDIILPLDVLFDVVEIFAKRLDPWSLESLLHFAKTNLVASSPLLLQPNEQFQLLAEFSLSRVLFYSDQNFVLTLWKRMSSLGYLAGRRSFEAFLESISISERIVSIYFIIDIHNSFCSNLWNQSPEYYVKIVNAIENYVHGITDEKYEMLSKCIIFTKKILDEITWFENLGKFSNNKVKFSAFSTIDMTSALTSLLTSLILRSESKIDSFPHLRIQLNCFKNVVSDRIQLLFNIHNSLVYRKPGVRNLEREVFILCFSPLISESNSVIKSVSTVATESVDMIYRRTIGLIRRAIKNWFCLISASGDIQNGDIQNILLHFQNYVDIIKNVPEALIGDEGNRSLDTLLESTNTTRTLKLDEIYNTYLNDLITRQATAIPSEVFKFYKSSYNFWINQLACEILLSFEKLKASLLDIDSQYNQSSRQMESLNNLNKLANGLILSIRMSGMHPNDLFYGAWIRSILRIRFLSKFAKPALFNLEDNQDAAKCIVSSLNDKDKDSPVVYHSLITLLCDHQSPEAIIKACRLVQDCVMKKQVLFPVSWNNLIVACIKHLSKLDRNILVPILEKLIKQAGETISNDTSVLKAILFANCKIKNSFKALQILQFLKARGDVITLQEYAWIIQSLYHYDVRDKSDLALLLDPEATCAWFLKSIRNDGYILNPSLLHLLVRLFTKAAAIAKRFKTKISPYDFIQKAITFVDKCKDGYLGHPSVSVNELVTHELLHAFCSHGFELEAFELKKSNPLKYGYSVTSLSFDPFIFYYSRIKRSKKLVQEVLTAMQNENVSISQLIVDYVIAMHANLNEPAEALDQIQLFYTERQIKPSCNTILRVLDMSLREKDYFEAMRVVTVIEQIFSETERQNIMSLGDYDESKVHLINEPSFISINNESSSSILDDNVVEEKVLIQGILSPDESDSKDAVTRNRPIVPEDTNADPVTDSDEIFSRTSYSYRGYYGPKQYG